MTSDIAFLRPAETIAFDHDRLAAVCNEYGHRAEAYIAFVLSRGGGAGADRRAPARRPRPACGAAATDLVRLCDTIGMATLAAAGRAVLDCLGRDDAPALGACTARLLRLGEARGPRRLDARAGRRARRRSRNRRLRARILGPCGAGHGR